MASVVQEAHLPALDHHRREEVGNELQATLLELVDLSLIGKQLHRNIFGRPFKPLREHLDELVDNGGSSLTPSRSEPLRLASRPTARLRRLATAARSPPSTAERSDSDAALRELVERLADVAERSRARMDRLGEIDLASQDVRVGVVRELEKQLWMLRASMPAGAS